jgi:hypothetical protein
MGVRNDRADTSRRPEEIGLVANLFEEALRKAIKLIS